MNNVVKKRHNLCTVSAKKGKRLYLLEIAEKGLCIIYRNQRKFIAGEILCAEIYNGECPLFITAERVRCSLRDENCVVFVGNKFLSVENICNLPFLTETEPVPLSVIDGFKSAFRRINCKKLFDFRKNNGI